MNPEEKSKGIIVESIKHTLPLNAKSMEVLEIRIKDCLADIPKTSDLSFVIKDTFKDNIDLCCKPIRINFINEMPMLLIRVLRYLLKVYIAKVRISL